MEVAAGSRFEVAQAFHEACPGAEVVVTDVDPAVEAAPTPLVARVDDLLDPTFSIYRRADLIYALRLPEELQVPAARLARNVGADFAHRPLATEIVDLSDLGGTQQVLQGWEVVRWSR